MDYANRRRRTCQFPLASLLLLFCHFLQTAFSCIGFGGGCALLGYPSYQCAPAYYSAYYPVGGCYGAYCRNRLKGSPLLALNGTSEEGVGGGGGGEGAPEEDEKGRGGGKEATIGSESSNIRERDGFGEIQASPDALFFECCQSWSLPPQCLLKCSFANYSSETLRSMFLRSDECPIESASIIHFCASQNQDHRPCCLEAGIDKTKAGEKCLIFCDQMPQNETRLDLTYLPCFERFSEMKRCFYENALRTIDYLEAELEEIRREEGGGAEEAEGRGKGEGGNRDGAFTAIGRPPIIFANDLRQKHPRINDDYFVEEEEEEDEKEGGKRRKGRRGGGGDEEEFRV